MTIRLTYEELRLAVPALKKLFAQEFSSMKFLIKLKKMFDVCEREFQTFEEARFKLIQKYGEKKTNEKGEEYMQVSDENMKVFENELAGVLTTEIDLGVEPLKMEELEEASKGVEVKFTPADIKYLEKFFVE